MRTKLGKTFTVNPDPAPVGAPEPAPAPVKADVEETIIGVVNGVLKLSLPPTTPDGHNKLMELRAYIVAHDQPIPADEDGYVNSKLPHAAVDVSDWHGTLGGPLDIPLPVEDRAAVYHGQLVHFYEA